MTREERHAQFVKEWYDLRNRYLDYYVEFWAPDDVIQVVQDAGGLPEGMDMENVVLDVMERLRTGHDASQGVTWETLEQIYDIILEEDKVLKKEAK